MLQKISLYFLLLVAILLVSCGGDTDPEPSTPIAGIDEAAIVDIEIIHTIPEFRVVKTEETEQPNCGGTDSIENVVGRSRAITHIIEVGGELTVSAEGSVGISGTNVQLGTSVASHLNYAYGTEETLERSVVVKAAPGSHMMHTIEQREIWDVGEAIITINGQESPVKFSFRRDFAVQAVNSVDLECPIEGESTLQEEPEILTETPTEETLNSTSIPTSTATEEPLTLTPTPIPTKLSSQFSETFNDVTYTLVEANYVGSDLILTFIAFNEGADKSSCLYFTSSLTDSAGVEHRQSSRFGGGASGGLDCLNFDIPHAVPTQFGLVFNSLPPTETNIPFAKVVFRGEGERQFRNIPVPHQTSISELYTVDSENDGQLSQILNDATYRLVEASYNGNDLILTFIANNEGADKEVCLYFDSFLIDIEGVEHRQSSRFGGGRSGGLDCLNFDIPYAVPTQFGLVFNTLPPTLTNIPFVKVDFRGDGEVQFRNITVPYQEQ